HSEQRKPIRLPAGCVLLSCWLNRAAASVILHLRNAQEYAMTSVILPGRLSSPTPMFHSQGSHYEQANQGKGCRFRREHCSDASEASPSRGQAAAHSEQSYGATA